MSLGRGAVRGTAWSFATILFERAFGFLILGILLRFIPAAAVGVVAIGSAMTDLVRMLAVGGAGEQVQAAPGDKIIEAGAFWSQMLASLVLIVILLAAAPVIGRLYNEPSLVWVLQILAVNIFLTAFVIVPSAILTSQFKFRAIGLISFASTVAGGLSALPFAIAGHGVQALVLQRLIGTLFFAVAACLLTRWWPPLPPAWRVLRNSFKFALPLMQASLVDYVSMTAYVMIVGLRMSIADVGRFRIAQRLVEVLQEIAFAPARKVFLPIFVAVRHDPDRRYDATMLMLDVLMIFIFAAAAIAGAAARPLVLLMFGARWSEAVPVFAILTLMAPVTALYGVINPLLTAIGRTHLVSVFALGNVVIIIAAAWFFAPYGLIVLAWALAARGLLTIFLFIPAMRIGLGRPVLPLLRLLVAPVLALATARLAAFAALSRCGAMPLVLQLAIAIAVSGMAFAAVMLILARHRMHRAIIRLRAAFAGQAPA
jgi:O-antigen/teichoic acid export membrane protein